MKSIRNDEVLLAELNKTAADRSSAVEKAQRIRDAEAAVIAAAEAQEQAMTALSATDEETAESALDTLTARCEQAASYVMLSVRALREARKP